MTKSGDSIVGYMLRDAQRTIKRIVKRKQQALTPISLNVVEHFRDRMRLRKLTQSSANLLRKCEVINIGHWSNRIASNVHSVGRTMCRVKRRNLGGNAGAFNVKNGIRGEHLWEVLKKGCGLLQTFNDPMERSVEINTPTAPSCHNPKLLLKLFSCAFGHGRSALVRRSV
jgi:hypothetical protein